MVVCVHACVCDGLALVDEHEQWILLVEQFHGFMATRGRESNCNLSLTETEKNRKLPPSSPHQGREVEDVEFEDKEHRM